MQKPNFVVLIQPNHKSKEYSYELALFSLALCVTSLPLWIGCSGSSDNPVDTQSELTGQVINTSQIGVRNATVALVKQGESSPTFTTTTNDTGGYVIRNIPSGAYALRLSAAGYTARV